MRRHTPRVGSVRVFRAALYDLIDRSRGVHRLPPDGTRVRVIQPYGCPPNGTMGHCFVEHADSGEFIGLVQVASLHKVDAPVVVEADLHDGA